MVNDNISNMLSSYKLNTEVDRENALKEIIQNIALLGLQAGGFFQHAAFYGGTALRICHNLNRFSEDLDFCLNQPDEKFTFKPYFESIQKALENYGFSSELMEKEKKILTTVKSAFVKQNTYAGLVTIGLARSNAHPDKKVKIKLEVDTQNPNGAGYEKKLVLSPIPFQVTILDMPSLFAGKLHAVLAREYKNRVKGRDFFDWLFYAQKRSKVNFDYLSAKLLDSKHIEQPLKNMDELKKLLHAKIDSTDFAKAKDDVQPFVSREVFELSIANWEKDFFHAVVDELASK